MSRWRCFHACYLRILLIYGFRIVVGARPQGKVITYSSLWATHARPWAALAGFGLPVWSADGEDRPSDRGGVFGVCRLEACSLPASFSAGRRNWYRGRGGARAEVLFCVLWNGSAGS